MLPNFSIHDTEIIKQNWFQQQILYISILGKPYEDQ